MTHLDFMQVTFADPVVQALLEEWNAELGFIPAGGATVEVDDFTPPGGLFMVAKIDGAAAGCGGIRQLSAGVGEVKRLFVRPNVRRRGVARALLAELEGRANVLGFRELRLDTHAADPAALFAAAGYELTEDYNHNPYARYWFAKRLRAP